MSNRCNWDEHFENLAVCVASFFYDSNANTLVKNGKCFLKNMTPLLSDPEYT